MVQSWAGIALLHSQTFIHIRSEGKIQISKMKVGKDFSMAAAAVAAVLR